MTLLRTLSTHAKGKESGYQNSILVTLPPSLLASSKYRDDVLEFANILRTKSYKYNQFRGGWFHQPGSNFSEVCAFGVYQNEKYGHPSAVGIIGSPRPNLPATTIIYCNDRLGWTFDQIADELERGVSIVQ